MQRQQHTAKGGLLPSTLAHCTKWPIGAECFEDQALYSNASGTSEKLSHPTPCLLYKQCGLVSILISREFDSISATFQLWQPKVYKHYSDHLEKLYKHMPHLYPIFLHSIYPCAPFNFGENVWHYPHRDVMNCPFAFCTITAFGHFNLKKGSHIILWEPKLILEFPTV